MIAQRERAAGNCGGIRDNMMEVRYDTDEGYLLEGSPDECTLTTEYRPK